LKKSHILAVGVSAVTLFASGIGLTVASVYDWSTTPSSNANSDPGINWAEGMLPSAVNDSARATMAAIAAFFKDSVVATAGSGNAYTATYTQAMRAWTPGIFSFVPNRTNTGAATFSRDGLAPKPMRAASGVPLNANQLLTGALYFASYNQVSDEVLITGKFGIVASDYAPVAGGTVKANITGSTTQPSDVTLAAFFGAAPPGSINASAVSTTAAYTGEVRAFYLSSCPASWVVADGNNGSPDLRGVVVRGLDGGRNLDPGRTLGSYQADSFASHNHGVTDPGHVHAYQIPVNQSTLTGSTPVSLATAQSGSTTSSAVTGISIQNAGGAETRSKNVALLYCYKT
jgi:hypothetical protein